MICKGICVTYVSHYRCRVGVPSNLHDLIQSRVVNSRAGNKARPQRMPCYVFRVQSDECCIMLKDTRNIAMVHRLSSQMSSSLHCLEKRPLGDARASQPQSKALYRTNDSSIQDRYPLSFAVLVSLGLAYRQPHAVLIILSRIKELNIIDNQIAYL